MTEHTPFIETPEQRSRRLQVAELFEVWAKDHLGQGYGLEKDEGTYINPVTRWAAKAFRAGTSATAEHCAVLCDEQAEFHQEMHNTQAEQAADACAAAIRGGV